MDIHGFPIGDPTCGRWSQAAESALALAGSFGPEFIQALAWSWHGVRKVVVDGAELVEGGARRDRGVGWWLMQKLNP